MNEPTPARGLVDSYARSFVHIPIRSFFSFAHTIYLLLTPHVICFAACVCAAKSQNHHQTHHLFLTRRALYVIAFDINKYRPQHFKQQIMFFVSKLQSRVPAAPVVLVGTHADMVNEEEANERCAHVLSMLTRKQQRERRRVPNAPPAAPAPGAPPCVPNAPPASTQQ